MAKATIIMKDGSRFQAETTNVPPELEAKVFPEPKMVTREIVLSTRPENPAERMLLQKLAVVLAQKGRSCHLLPHQMGISIVANMRIATARCSV